MKISINGDIIDTKDIYMITKIDRYETASDEAGSWERTPSDPDKGGILRFKIRFFNKKSISIEKSLYNFDKNVKDPQLPIKPHLRKMEEFRDSLIDVWSNNQLSIPQFNFETGGDWI